MTVGYTLQLKKRGRKQRAPRRTVSVKTTRLAFPNKFRSTGFLPPPQKTFTQQLNLLNGVQSVELAEQQRNIQRQIERYNAGILSEKEQFLKDLAQKDKERKMKRMLQKVAELEGLTAEQIQNLDLERKARHLVLSDKVTGPNRNYPETPRNPNIIEELRRIGEVGHGVIPLYKRLKPDHSLLSEETPTTEREKQENGHDERREKFKHAYELLYGIQPPPKIIDSALPRTVEPIHMKTTPSLKQILKKPYFDHYLKL